MTSSFFCIKIEGTEITVNNLSVKKLLLLLFCICCKEKLGSFKYVSAFSFYVIIITLVLLSLSGTKI